MRNLTVSHPVKIQNLTDVRNMFNQAHILPPPLSPTNPHFLIDRIVLHSPWPAPVRKTLGHRAPQRSLSPYWLIIGSVKRSD